MFLQKTKKILNLLENVDNEKDIRVVCDGFNQNYQHDNVYSLSAVFRRVYES